MIRKWKILRSVPERLDVRIVAHGSYDYRKVTFSGKYRYYNYMDQVSISSTKK